MENHDADAPDIVVGSGPAGVACASALLERGRKVLMLDAGIGIEDFRAKIVDQLKASAPGEWDPALLARLKENIRPDRKGIPLKLSFGSDFPYRETDEHLPSRAERVALRPSLAIGGHSNVWGAAMLPYLDRDLSDWPIRTGDLAPHYEAVLRLTGFTGWQDDLAEFFPLYSPAPPKLDLSRQAAMLLRRFERHRDLLARRGMHFGVSRLAVKAQAAPGAEGCVYCGMCLYGCPYGYIYNSADTVAALKKNPRFVYERDVIVRTFEEGADEVELRGYRRGSGEEFRKTGARLFLAAGVIPTTRILLESLGEFGRTLWIKDSQYFLLPLLSFKGAGDVRAEALHTLSQLYVEIFDSALSERTIHLQLYSYNELIGETLRNAMGPFGRIDPLVRLFEKRMMVAQCYLHSDLSQKISITLEKEQGKAKLKLAAVMPPETRVTIRKVIAKLARLAPKMGAVPLGPLLQLGEAGRGFHSGGTFPMRSNPGPFETDVLGRPHGLKRVHAVDSTVFPSIPATTITFSSMANARRIGWEACG